MSNAQCSQDNCRTNNDMPQPISNCIFYSRVIYYKKYVIIHLLPDWHKLTQTPVHITLSSATAGNISTH